MARNGPADLALDPCRNGAAVKRQQLPAAGFYALLYFVQGVSIAYFSNFQKPYLAAAGIGPEAIGALTALLLLPFIGKLLFGLLSDRVPVARLGRRRPWLLLGLLLASAGFAAAALFDLHAGFRVFAACMVTASLGVALFDASADGLAVDSTAIGAQARVQSAMVSGRALGVILLSLVFGRVASLAGYEAVFAILALAPLLPMLWVLRLCEPAQARAEAPLSRRDFAFFLRRPVLSFVLYAVGYSITSFGVDGLLTYALSARFGAGEEAIARFGALRGTGSVLGALLAGWLLSRHDRVRVGIAALLMLSAAAALVGNLDDGSSMLVFALPWGMVWGFQETVFVTCAMALAARESRARIGGLTFAALMACSNTGTAITEGVATGLTDDLGFTGVFRLLALWGLLVLPWFWGCRGEVRG